MFHEIREIPTAAYGKIVAQALALQFTFTLVWRETTAFGTDSSKIVDVLGPCFLGENYTRKWPGTELLDSRAWVRHYRMDDVSFRCLSIVSDLYDWMSPRYPEDLTFYDRDGNCCLATTSHEHYACIVPVFLNALTDPAVGKIKLWGTHHVRLMNIAEVMGDSGEDFGRGDV